MAKASATVRSSSESKLQQLAPERKITGRAKCLMVLRPLPERNSPSDSAFVWQPGQPEHIHAAFYALHDFKMGSSLLSKKNDDLLQTAAALLLFLFARVFCTDAQSLELEDMARNGLGRYDQYLAGHRAQTMTWID
jgi:hypothetical protein